MTDQPKIQPGQLYEVLPDGKRWAIFLDASMCFSLGLCPQLFKYRYVDHIVPKGDVSYARDIGSWWSAVMEETYARMAKEEKLDGLTLVKLATEKWNELGLPLAESLQPKRFKEFGGLNGAIQMICEYADRQLPIDYLQWKIIAAEASFGRDREVVIGETDKVVLYWLGQPDLAVASQGRLMPVDHKTVESIDGDLHKKYKPNIQFPGYIIAMQHLCKQLGYALIVDRCIVNVCARKDVTKKDGDKRPRFTRLQISFSQEELEEWRARRLQDAERLRRFIESGQWPWHEAMCNNIFFRPCSYRNIDSKPPGGAREAVKDADYIQVRPWLPGRTKAEEGK